MILLETNWSLFIGRLHPLVVHLPIGFLLIAAVMEWFARKPKYKSIDGAISFVLLAGALSSVAAAFIGWLLAGDGSYEGDTLFWHKWLGFGVAALSIVAWLMKSGRLKASRTAYAGAMIGIVALLTFTGHLGGNMTHGENYLSEHAPAPIAALLGAKKTDAAKQKAMYNPDSVLVYQHIVQPLLNVHCVECHNDNKTKGGLKYHTAEAIQAGGDGGPVFVAGNAFESEMIQRVSLPQTSVKFMPTSGTPMSINDVKILEWWINSGASFDASLAQTELTDEIKMILENKGISTVKKPYVETASVDAAAPAALEKINGLGLSAIPLAAGNNFIDLKPAAVGNPISTEQLQALQGAKEQIAWINFSRSELKDEDIQVLASMPNLTKVRLELNPIGDEAVKHLADLEHLEYLNLYGTKVTDASIPVFEKMKGLKKLYLWQSEVTREGAEKLKASRPDMIVEMGLDLAQKTSEG